MTPEYLKLYGAVRDMHGRIRISRRYGKIKQALIQYQAALRLQRKLLQTK